MNFEEFFQQATGFQPYDYQKRIASDGDQIPSLIKIPTGSGKTEAIVLAYLWRRKQIPDKTPRRLVYCLPMRVLVEQTRDRIDEILNKLRDTLQMKNIHVYTIMGGENEENWDYYPEEEAIIIGTQDMLLSKALNRGYAMSRYRWPVHFALLNNDCIWVFDEVQLMGNGLATSAQLHAFRKNFGTVMPVHSVWMSATLDKKWLKTVDLDSQVNNLKEVALSNQDKAHPELAKRLQAKKPLAKSDFNMTNDCKKEAEFILKKHKPNTRTLVIVNTIDRAVEIYDQIRKHLKKQKSEDGLELVLLHSRFRPEDRKSHLDRLLESPPNGGTICISTQVVEAGVDVSANLLVTDLAPISSMIQRFGRCNRYGNEPDPMVYWIEPSDYKKQSAPYKEEELKTTKGWIENIHDASPCSLSPPSQSMKFSHVIRQRDIIDLFDTTPDLAGSDIDVSRFIREAEKHDVYVFWREIDPKSFPKPDEPLPSREELCPVAINKITDTGDYWSWDHIEKRWVRPQYLYPGMYIMKRACDGGYDSEVGWNEKNNNTVAVIAQSTAQQNKRHGGQWVSLQEHTEKVVQELGKVLQAIPELKTWRSDLEKAAYFHDIGKAHDEFQNALKNKPDENWRRETPTIPPAEFQKALENKPDEGTYWAKSPQSKLQYKRKGFRHELASGLGMLQNGASDLAVYLATAHHGKVRLSIRSFPHENPPNDDPNKRFARGIWEGDKLPEINLGCQTFPATTLTLSYMELGWDAGTGKSWVERMISLRDKYGIFILGFLEAIIRICDWRASAEDVPVRDNEEDV